MRQTSSVRREPAVGGEIGELEVVGAGQPLYIASDGNDHRTVRGVEELIWNEVSVRVSPSHGIAAADQGVLCDVHERRFGARRECDVETSSQAGSSAFDQRCQDR